VDKVICDNRKDQCKEGAVEGRQDRQTALKVSFTWFSGVNCL